MGCLWRVGILFARWCVESFKVLCEFALPSFVPDHGPRSVGRLIERRLAALCYRTLGRERADLIKKRRGRLVHLMFRLIRLLRAFGFLNSVFALFVGESDLVRLLLGIVPFEEVLQVLFGAHIDWGLALRVFHF